MVFPLPSGGDDDAADAAAGDQHAEDAPEHRATCLLIDSEEAARAVLARMLDALGFEVRSAGSAASAVDAWRAEVPDLIVVDWDSAEAAARAIFAVVIGARCEVAEGPAGGRPTTRLVAAICRRSSGPVRAAIAAGADDIFAKPYDADRIESQLRLMGLA